MILEHLYFNRIKKIINNKSNSYEHLDAIRNILINYKNMFGSTKLYLRLLNEHTELFFFLKQNKINKQNK